MVKEIPAEELLNKTVAILNAVQNKVDNYYVSEEDADKSGDARWVYNMMEQLSLATCYMGSGHEKYEVEIKVKKIR